MTENTRPARRWIVAGVLAALAAGAAGDVDTSALASRHATFRSQREAAWEEHGDPHGGYSNEHRVRQSFDGEVNPIDDPELVGPDSTGRTDTLDDQIGITSAHDYATGEGIVVAVLDCGFNLGSPWIADQVLSQGFDPLGMDWDPEDSGNGVDDDGDGVTDGGVGHGTFVAGMILSVAPDAWILPVRIADDEGNGYSEDLAEGISYAIDMGVDVINISFETGSLSQLVRDKLERAHDHGIAVVVSVGNDGDDEVLALAAEGSTIAVGSVDDDDVIADFSNTPSDGEGLTLFAPGVELYGPYGSPTDDQCALWSGTSFSAALVSGAAALALELDGTLTPAQLKERLEDASTAPVTASDATTYGYAGRIDLLDLVGP